MFLRRSFLLFRAHRALSFELIDLIPLGITPKSISSCPSLALQLVDTPRWNFCRYLKLSIALVQKGRSNWSRNDAKAETPVLWPLHAKSWLIGKDSEAGRDWGQEEKGMTEDEMAGWHRWLDGHESQWTPGVGDGQGGLACCDSWGRKESDTTERLIWSDLILKTNLKCSLWTSSYCFYF